MSTCMIRTMDQVEACMSVSREDPAEDKEFSK